MDYKCFDYFMVRTPELPIQYLQDFESQGKDIYEYISSNTALDLFFRKALLVSSRTLYETYVNKPDNAKKYEKLKSSLLKFFVRSTSRTTPYGYFASVSMGRFSKETNLVKGECNIDLRVDNNWVNSLVYHLEKDEKIFHKLLLHFNSLCFVSGDRMKNPYFTNHGTAKRGESVVRENSIKYSPLIELIEKETSSFVNCNELCDVIKKHYKADDKVVSDTIRMLLDNEYLFSNLRIPAYCDDSLIYILNELKKIGFSGELVEKLNGIIILIKEYKLEENPEVLKRIFDIMFQVSRVDANENFVILNTGNQLICTELADEIKEKTEKLVNFLARIPVRVNTLEKFKQRFAEKYGVNVEVPVFKIIDKNDFDGLKWIEMNQVEDTELEQEICKVIDKKIFEGIMNGDKEVVLSSRDFEKISLQTSGLVKSFDLNIMLTNSTKKYEIYIAPNSGDDKAGAMFQRFSQCLESEALRNYNNIYTKEENLCKDDYLLIEARETLLYGKINNIVNSNRNHSYYLSFGNCSNPTQEGEITLNDLYIGMTDNQDLYIKSKSYNKRVKIVCDNMINPNYCNSTLKLLKSISQTYEQSIGNRLAKIRYELKNKYQPRIRMEDVFISPQTWILDDKDFCYENLSEFSEQLKLNVERYHIDKIVYQENFDNRLIVNLEDEKYIKVLYLEFKKKKKLRFTELEKGLLENNIVKDKYGRGYIGEFVFSYTMGKEENQRFLINQSFDSVLKDESGTKLLCEDGWVYFKLYGSGDREDEIIAQDLPLLLSCLGTAQHFYIRYSDSEGRHLRIRIKFSDAETGIKGLSSIIKWANNLLYRKKINHIIFDMYEQEINRYGGEELIEYCENVFMKDSLTIERILRLYDITEKETLEKCYIYGIVQILRNLTDNIDEILSIMDYRSFENKYRQEYRKKHKVYMEIVQDLLDENIEKYLDILPEYLQEKESLNKYKAMLGNQIRLKKNTNSKEGIVLSIVHMYCNRLTGNREYESKYSEIVRNALYHLAKKKQNKLSRG